MSELKKVFEEDKPILTRDELIYGLKKIFKKHIGREKAIRKAKLFKKLFGDPSYYDHFELWYQWNRIKICMNWLRRTTKYFIVSRPNKQYPSIWEYFVVVDDTDAEHYKRLLRGSRKKINYMLKRVDKAVQKNFWKDVQDGKAD